MPDLGTGKPIDPDPLYYSVKDFAHLTRRSSEMVRRFIRDGVIRTIPDPHDRRTVLIPDTEVPKVLSRPNRGYRKRKVTLTLSDGRTVTRVIPVRK
jgi:hypothetical protein